MTDTEMLDWLESNEALVNTADHPKRGPHVAVDIDGSLAHFHRKTYREAIKAAADEQRHTYADLPSRGAT